MAFAVLAASLDLTVLNLALATLAKALHASESDLQWFSAAYALVMAAGMLPAGLLGDRVGRKRVLMASLVIFGVGSLACAYAPSAGAFIAARAVLGLAAAGLIPMVVSSFTTLFSEAERPRAVGIWAAANFLALPLGPILGGWVLTHYWWGWVFLANIPVTALALAIVIALVPESRSPQPPHIDLAGILSSSAGLAILTYGLIEAGQNGWTSGVALRPLGIGVVVLAGFGLWQFRLSRVGSSLTLIDFGLFRSRNFSYGTLLAALANLPVIGLLFTVPQYFQAIIGVDAQGAGLRLLPLIAGLVVGAVPADRLASRIGAKLTIALGFALLAAGLLTGATAAVSSGDGFIAVWTAVSGAGMGLALATATSRALVDLPEERSGIGSASMQALQKLGSPFGVALLGSALNAVYRQQLDVSTVPAAAGEVARQSVFAGLAVAQELHAPALTAAVQSAFVAGMDRALTVAGVIAVAGLVLALLLMPQSGRAQPTTVEGPEGKDVELQPVGVG
jgi:EmrB/QacA subfamily drug resistance transporter